tara:strand:- start:4026 stop:4727 length:702 start_codon:yes stop_codon:yes gene_type:complete
MNFIPKKEYREKPLVVLCNGPSIKNLDFALLKNQDVIAMNGIYRFCYENDWYPKYFGCFDYRVTDNHTEAYAKFIEESPIERGFLLTKVTDSDKLTVLPINGNIGDFSLDFKTFGYGGNTGANCCQVGICLGYTKIIILGADCNYKEVVEGAKPEGSGLVMDQTPEENPNYFFSSYQRKGDIYNFPQAELFHRPAWNSLAEFAGENNIEVVNCSESSTLTCFKKSKARVELKK